MDINEARRGFTKRHPWELSRTERILHEWEPVIQRMHQPKNAPLCYINVGAGDMYFDDALMRVFTSDELYAVDVGYDLESGEIKQDGRKHLAKDIKSIDREKSFNYCIMMDSLEYMEDDRAFVTELAAKIKLGGYLFFTVPAYKKLFSEHDVHVKNLRRYDKKEIITLLSSIPDIEVIDVRHFYFLLYLIRKFQVLFKLRIDPNNKITTDWKHSESSLVTKVVKGVLNLDYRLGRHLPGLSLMVICKKAIS